MRRIVLVLTGCILPNVSDTLAVSDAESRKQMYVSAILWYLENTEYKVVFGENSGHSVKSCIHGQYLDRYEELTYSSVPTIPNRSRGYKEMEILEYVQANSTFIKDADLIVKITGRLVLRNIKSLIHYLINKDCPNGLVSSMQYQDKRGSDCRFIFFTPQFFPCLLNQKEKITEEVTFEAIMEDAIAEATKKGMMFFLPRWLYRIHGIGMGGKDGKAYVYDRPWWWYVRYNIGYQLLRLRVKKGLSFRRIEGVQ